MSIARRIAQIRSDHLALEDISKWHTEEESGQFVLTTKPGHTIVLGPTEGTYNRAVATFLGDAASAVLLLLAIVYDQQRQIEHLRKQLEVERV